jgi:hypothetical protein
MSAWLNALARLSRFPDRVYTICKDVTWFSRGIGVECWEAVTVCHTMFCLTPLQLSGSFTRQMTAQTVSCTCE